MNIAILTPCYGGMIHSRTAAAIAYAIADLACRDSKVTWLQLEGESLVPRARNVLVGRFLASNADRCLMIDGDIACSPHDILNLLECDEDVVGVAYPKKKPGPIELVFSPLVNGEHKGPLTEVARIGTGFLSLSRNALEQLVLVHPETAYLGEGNRILHAIFDTAIINGQYLSEDWLFCDRWRANGGKVWMHTGIRLGHIGSMTYWSNKLLE